MPAIGISIAADFKFLHLDTRQVKQVMHSGYGFEGEQSRFG
jgi:hypothetical protein